VPKIGKKKVTAGERRESLAECQGPVLARAPMRKGGNLRGSEKECGKVSNNVII